MNKKGFLPMGLDNYPINYPCVKAGTAVRDDNGEIVCEATIRQGLCPFTNARDAAGMTEGAVHGMFGTDCWYRGKWGNYLISQLGLDDNEISFYGDIEDATVKTPLSCQNTADAMESALTRLGGTLRPENSESDLTSQVKYAIWWLRYVAANADGSAAWY